MVSVHGITRQWRSHVTAMARHCERENAVLIAPFMHERRLPHYQRLGTGSERSDQFLQESLREVANLSGADVSRIFLFGHSGGAQFAHRYAMAYPHRVHTVVAVAAGWYTFPDPALKYPHGIRASSRLPGVLFDPEQYLRVPMYIFVGTEDIGHERVRRSESIDALQGVTRLERARRWTQAMQAQAKAFSMPPLVALNELPGVGHDFHSLCQDAAVTDRAFLLFHPVTQ